MKHILASTIVTVLLALPPSSQAFDGIPPSPPEPLDSPGLTYRPSPAPPDVERAAALLAAACRGWERIPVPVTAGEAPVLQVTATSHALSSLCSVAEAPAELERYRAHFFWFGVVLGAGGLWLLHLLLRLLRSGYAVIRHRLINPVTT